MPKTQKSFEERLAEMTSSVGTGASAGTPQPASAPAPAHAPAKSACSKTPLLIALALALAVGVPVGLFADRIVEGVSVQMAQVKQAASGLADGVSELAEQQTLYVTETQAKAATPDSPFANAPKQPTGFAAAIQKRQSENFVKNFNPDDFTAEGMERKRQALQKISDQLDDL